MKKTLLTLFTLAIGCALFAQQDVYLQINHKLGTEPFSFQTEAENGMGHKFKTSRLEYYISGIKLTYDGGQDTLLSETYFLANAGSAFTNFLGNFNFTALEAISFAIGVEDPTNHEDPAQYNAQHPLAPKNPSMHWGWAGGYRFVAFEGVAGPSLNQTLEIHALGDANYKWNNITTAGTVVDGKLIIALNADYIQMLNGISINSGLINHSETGEAATLIDNFQASVFSEGEVANTSVETVHAANSMVLFPNPVGAGNSFQLATLNLTEGMRMSIYSVDGKLISNQPIQNFNTSVTIASPGLYTVVVEDSKNTVLRNKIVVY